MRLRDYLWKRQDGRCYLRATAACIAVDGALHRDQLGKGACDPRGWTWEHVIPRARRRALVGKGPGLKLLACQPCNQAKGAKRPADLHIEQALAILVDFYDAERADWLRALVQAYRARPCAGGPLEKPPRIRGVAFVSPLPEGVPATVEEALAQGGRSARARELGVTDERFLPGGKARAERNAHSRASALRGIADRAEKQGDLATANNLRAKAWAIIDAAHAAKAR